MKFKKIKIVASCPECGGSEEIFYNHDEDIYYCENCNSCFCYGDIDFDRQYETEIIEIQMEGE